LLREIGKIINVFRVFPCKAKVINLLTLLID